MKKVKENLKVDIELNIPKTSFSLIGVEMRTKLREYLKEKLKIIIKDSINNIFNEEDFKLEMETYCEELIIEKLKHPTIIQKSISKLIKEQKK